MFEQCKTQTTSCLKNILDGKEFVHSYTEDIRVLTDQNAELAEELAEERSNRERIEAERDRLADVDNENMALRRQVHKHV